MTHCLKTVLACLTASLLTGGCVAVSQAPPRSKPPANPLPLLERISYGADPASVAALQDAGTERYVWLQLHPGPDAGLPPVVARHIEAMTISQRPVEVLWRDSERQRRLAEALPDPNARKLARDAWQKSSADLAYETRSRTLLMAVYSSYGLREIMTGFWMNHFSVFEGKGMIRVLVADYESRLREHALGRFRDLLEVTAHHPAMLRYLDNEQNAAGHLNENYARELMELHTLGIGGGYTQRDVQELARVLTGVGIEREAGPPRIRKTLLNQYVARGVFEFNPERHDYGAKWFLGQPIRGRGLAELDEALDRLAASPATAHFISRKLAVLFVSEAPSPALVEQLSTRYLASDGSIASVLDALFHSREFVQAPRTRFKDPLRYVLSAARLANGQAGLVNIDAVNGGLNRLGRPLYGHTTPDGYPSDEASWSSAGQLNRRFEVARMMAQRLAPDRQGKGQGPWLATSVFTRYATLSPASRAVLAGASAPQDWNSYLLSSPEFMQY